MSLNIHLNKKKLFTEENVSFLSVLFLNKVQNKTEYLWKNVKRALDKRFPYNLIDLEYNKR